MLTLADRRAVTRILLAIALLWAALVTFGAGTGILATLHMPLIAAIVATTIVVPTLIYAASPRLQAYADTISHRSIVMFHIWRVPAALLFFWYGAKGELPPTFWILAGTGDFMVGSYAAYLMFKPESARRYWSFHLFGFVDFVVAVGTGLTFTLLQDPRMSLVAALPMALIPLWGVGISGTTHLVAFDMLRRGSGMKTDRPTAAAIAS